MALRWTPIGIPLCALLLGGCGGATVAVDSLPDGGLSDSDEAEAAPPLDGDAGAQPLQIGLDQSFGTAGDISGPLSDWTPAGVAVDPQGRIVVSGPGNSATSPPSELVVRLGSDGTADPGFGISGRTAIGLEANERAQAIRCWADNSIGIMGAAPIAGTDGAFAVRLSADGSMDPAFFGQPLVTTSAGSFVTGLWQDDGSGLVFGSEAVSDFTPSGDLDTAPSAIRIAPATVAARAADGRLWTGVGSSLSRYLTSGAPDTSFGQSGSVELSSVSAVQPLTIQALWPEDGGGALVIGGHASGSSSFVDVLRVTTSGAVDTGYGAGGWLSLPSDGAGAVGAAELVDGRLIVWTSSGNLFAIASAGTQESQASLETHGTVFAATLDATQRLVVVGTTTSDPMFSIWFVRRYELR
jgi:uncharacterized delta-60 repeat protein